MNVPKAFWVTRSDARLSGREASGLFSGIVFPPPACGDAPSGHGANEHAGPVRPTAEPSGQIFASIVHPDSCGRCFSKSMRPTAPMSSIPAMMMADLFISPLFRRRTVELRLVGYGIGVGRAHDAVLVMRWRIDRVELECLGSRGIDDVVLASGRDNDAIAVADLVFGAVYDDLALAFLETEELIAALVRFESDLFIGQKRHQDQLAVFRRIEHLAEILVRERQLFDIPLVAFFHKRVVMNYSFIIHPPRHRARLSSQ